ncbi:hypothetical protein DKG74_08415 [Zavarzinia aquatilis]|uniref:Integrase catalytic domain-containing protein n=1 Tax=Zavarzinia aquatilis TaxID=2211142 RepID=A0A317EAK3_9PROT|nr:hypothetical protein DKG74_08415 [Zavarzinia aquatilis]
MTSGPRNQIQPTGESPWAFAVPDLTPANSGRMRDKLLNEPLFFSLRHAREAGADWIEDYNPEPPWSISDCG